MKFLMVNLEKQKIYWLKSFLTEEMSFFIISDGNTFKTFDTAPDHKKVLEGDKEKILGE